jgi:hypothetical protein
MKTYSKRQREFTPIMINYFASKEEIIGDQEYVQLADKPVKPYRLRKVFGSWSRMLRRLEDIDPVGYAAIVPPPEEPPPEEPPEEPPSEDPETPEDPPPPENP